MKATALILMLAAATVTGYAKDKHYEIGTVERRMVDAGFVDTTTCADIPSGVRCGGGISEVSAPVYTLTFADGTKHHIEHVAMSRDTLKAMNFTNGPVQVQYRIDHKRGFGGGVDYAQIEDPVTHKEGVYSFDNAKGEKMTNLKREQETVKAMGERDAKAGHPIGHFYKTCLKRHSERLRAAYEIGWRAARDEMREATKTQ